MDMATWIMIANFKQGVLFFQLGCRCSVSGLLPDRNVLRSGQKIRQSSGRRIHERWNR